MVRLLHRCDFGELRNTDTRLCTIANHHIPVAMSLSLLCALIDPLLVLQLLMEIVRSPIILRAQW
jgi:hypothetical protein